jgi:hypothetical protein
MFGKRALDSERQKEPALEAGMALNPATQIPYTNFSTGIPNSFATVLILMLFILPSVITQPLMSILIYEILLKLHTSAYQTTIGRDEQSGSATWQACAR